MNNAGTSIPVSPLVDLDRQQWEKQVSINLTAPMFLTQKVLPSMKKHARIVNIVSMSKRIQAPGIASYAMTKAALDLYSKLLSKELSDNDLLVTSAHPGLVKTDVTESIIMDNTDQPISQYLSSLAKNKKFISTATSAEFLAWLLLEADDSLYTGDIIGLYDKKYHSYWCKEDIEFPYSDLRHSKK